MSGKPVSADVDRRKARLREKRREALVQAMRRDVEVLQRIVRGRSACEGRLPAAKNPAS